MFLHIWPCSSFCKKLKHLLLSLGLPILTFSSLLLCKCEDDFHLEYHASNQRKDSLKFVVEKHFDHHRRCISSQTLTVYQSHVLYAWTMLHDHLVDFLPIHVCWCLHFSELLAGIWSSCKLSNHYNCFIIACQHPLSSCIYQGQTACLPEVPKWLTYYLYRLDLNLIQSGKLCINCDLNCCWACSSICNSSEHHILWYLTWEQFFSVGIKILGYLTWVALTFCLKQG